MNPFDYMVSYLENREKNWNETILYSDEEHENASSALVESILLNGYQITDRKCYKTTIKKVTELVNE